jgi:phospholipase C
LLTRKKSVAAVLAAGALGATAVGISVSAASSQGTSSDPAAAFATTTPIKHLVVLFDENVSFDHYFATYPNALNTPDEPQFHALPNTPTVNGLSTALLDSNPNENLPQRLDPSQALTCDQNHGYTAEESAFDGGLMDKFVQDTQGTGCTQTTYPDNGSYGPNGIVMDYYDGNTVTGLWNYAQHFSLNDNSYSTQFGPSTPGAINVISGQTNGAVAEGGVSTNIANGTDIGDAEPYYDECSNATTPLSGTYSGTQLGAPGGVTMQMTGQNVGNLLNTKNITWGWFQGGFTPSSYVAGRPVCATAHDNIGGASVADYSEHHEPFQYYASTSNPYHNSPSSVAKVGVSDPAGTPLASAVNHQYDLTWFNQTLTNGNMPAVSYLKAPEYEDGHAGYSDPLDEQRFLVDEINQIEQSPDWSSTAIVIAYDDSDGWYDHQMGPIIRQSKDTADTLDGAGECGSATTAPAENDRCGVGPRQPLLVISPWAKQNYVDNTFTEQASIPQFIENNWGLTRVGLGSADASAGTLDNMFDFNQKYGHAPAVILNDTTGEIEKTIYPDGSTLTAGQADTPEPTTSAGSTQSSSSSGSNSVSSSPSASGSNGGSATVILTGQASSVKLPKVSCTKKLDGKHVAVTCTLKGSTVRATLIRARLYRQSTLIANVAHRVAHNKTRFHLALGKHARAGKYKVTISIDTAGAVRALVRNFRLS